MYNSNIQNTDSNKMNCRFTARCAWVYQVTYTLYLLSMFWDHTQVCGNSEVQLSKQSQSLPD